MNPSEIRNIAVLGGGGVIGSGWSTYFLWKQFPVVIYDINDQALTLSRDRITANIFYLVEKEMLTQRAATEALRRGVFTTNLQEAVRDAQLIQEAAPENYAAKQPLVAALDQYGSPDAIFASSTSGLLITEIAKFSRHPERCIGAHPYNPPHLIPLVEITKGDNTSDAIVQRAYDFYKRIGKEPIILKKEALGFISNRLQLALYREAIDLVLKGVCSVEDIDKAVCFGPGLRYALMGPNLIFQLGGGKVGIKGLLQHVGSSVEMWWADMADWKKWPAGSMDLLQEGVNQEMANRQPAEGRTTEEITLWRDDKLLKLLKLLNKI